MADRLTLYHYWRSSASWRVRWAFALKKIDCDFVPVNILKGETESPEHLARNPLGYLPALSIGNQMVFESLAIIEWAEEIQPAPSLLPGNAMNRATIRQLAEMINADTHPLQNLSAQERHSQDPVERKAWAQHWTRHGLQAYEKIILKTAGDYSVGDQVTLADLCLIPQIYNAKRQEVDLTSMPTLVKIYERAMLTPACRASAPESYNPE